ncbi:TonB-dependent receptor [Komagataeibacter xylinus]|uniref:TonB-dependent receptor n=1 Tax=Komagataeibacter xylinus TaxID=28448 RepID=A0A857FS64_KOMXY|nr:TonB-dependent receptor [Komagataeibacter xylinus]QHC35990.1 TonB-dependent receptor [Komagataeibacter xylinus]
MSLSIGSKWRLLSASSVVALAFSFNTAHGEGPHTVHGTKPASAGSGSTVRNAGATAKRNAALAATAPAGVRASGIEEVSVSAQKRTQSIQKVPLSVTAVSGKTLVERHIFDSQQLSELFPSLQLSGQVHNVSGVAWSIRGVGTAVFSDGVEPSVSTVIDGISYGRPEMAAVQFFDLNDIEVLEGPQGMLYGKNASAGVVNIQTNDARIGKFQSVSHVEYGNVDRPGGSNSVVAQTMVNLPVTDNSALRIAAFATYQPPFIKNLNNDRGNYGQTEFGARAKYHIDINDRLTLRIQGDITHEAGAGPSLFGVTSAAPGGFLASQMQKLEPGFGNGKAYNPYTYTNNTPSYGFNAAGAQGDVVYNLGHGYRIDNLFGYRFFEQTQSDNLNMLPFDVFDVDGSNKRDWQVSNEIKLMSPTGKRLEWVVGAYVFDGNYHTDYQQAGDGVGLGYPTPPAGEEFVGTNVSDYIHSRSYAGFAQLTYRLVAGLSFTGGIRYSHDDESSFGHSGLENSVVPMKTEGDYHYNVSANNISYKLGLQYQFNKNIMAYFSYTRGYKGPGLAVNPGVLDPVVKKEIPTAWELGIKSMLLNRHLVINASLWDEDFHGFQAQAFSELSAPANLLNAGNLISRGAEASVTAIPIQGLRLTGNMTYVDAYYGSFKGNPCYPGEANGTIGSNVCLPSGTSDATGNALANSSRWTYTVAADYTHTLTRKLDGFVGVNWYHRSGYNFSANGDPHTFQPGYGLFGFNLGISSKNHRWKVGVYGRNMLNTHYASWIVEDPIDGMMKDGRAAGKGGDYLAMYSADASRTVGFSADLQF